MFLKKLNKNLVKIRNRHFLIGDVIILLISPLLALSIRYDWIVNFSELSYGLISVTIIFTVLKIYIFYSMGLYKREWRNASIDELGRLLFIIAVTIFYQSIIFAIFYTFDIFQFDRLPLSLPLLDGIFTLMMISGLRLSIRLFERVDERRIHKRSGERVLVIGAGKAGSTIVQEMQRNPQLGMIPVAFVDDNKELKGFRIKGIPVAGIRSNIPEVIKKYSINKAIIAMPTAEGKDIRDIVTICKTAGVRTQTIPGIYELLDGNVRIDNIREVRIEDLLRRAPVKTDFKKVEGFIKGKTVLVTGSGGSIGSELCRQIIKARPHTLLLLGHGENSIFEIHHEIKRRIERSNGENLISVLKTIIADIRNENRINQVIEEYKPDVIFHAAAHKHVPIMEINSTEAVTNNILGTRNLLDAAVRNNVDHFILISTDKAVNPSSIMGASKRVAEMLVMKYANDHEKHYSAVRFGNVLGSRGSAVLTFRKQIAEGGPVTVTDSEIKRFFMTIPEAVQLVLQAAVIGKGGEVFVLDMGEPIKIIDLARDVIKLSGYEPGRDIKIDITGLRPGEKLFEELVVDGEEYERSEHEKILIASNANMFVPVDLDISLNKLMSATMHNNRDEIIKNLKEIVSEFTPSG